MSNLPDSRPFINITSNSTGTCPDGWRAFWATEARRSGSDWPSLLDLADAALRRLRECHLTLPSSIR